MPAFTTTANEKPAEATTPGGLILVFSTTAPSHGKDSTNDQYHDPRARRKP